MLDLGFVEIAFVALLALIVVGPKDLPKLVRLFGTSYAKIRRYYRDTESSIRRLEQEIDVASRPDAANRTPFDLLPEEVRALRSFDQPLGAATAYERRRVEMQSVLEAARDPAGHGQDRDA